jgi:hypothetical protein
LGRRRGALFGDLAHPENTMAALDGQPRRCRADIRESCDQNDALFRRRYS